MEEFPIFLSHASRDEALAWQLQELLQKWLELRSSEIIRKGRVVFRSSEEGSVGGGTDWYAEIIRILRGAKLCLTLLTPNSLHQPWLLYESGAAYALQPTLESRKLICVLAGGIEPYDLPAPYQRLQHRTLANKRSVAALLRDVASLVLGQDPFPSEEEIQAITGEIEAIQKVADSQRRWATVKPSLIVEASDGSPYNIEHLLQMADKRMVVIGQNLHWLSQTRECHDRIMRFLSDKPGRSFDIVICDADNEKAVEALSTVNPSMEIDDNTYFHHLKAATARFLAFRDRCHRDGVGTLTIHVRALIPFGATVIDPEGPDGLIVLQPLINHGPKAAERPQFPISKATNNRVFSYYWRCFDTLLNFGRRL